MTTLESIGFTIAGGSSVLAVTVGLFGVAVSRRSTYVAPRCSARPPDTIYNPAPASPVQRRGSPMLGWIGWTLGLTYDEMIRGVPGTGTRNGGLSGSLLKVNLDGIVLLRFHAVGARVTAVAAALLLLVGLPTYLSAQCYDVDDDAVEYARWCGNEYNLTNYERTTLANVPAMQEVTPTNTLLTPQGGTLGRLYGIVLIFWIIVLYLFYLLQQEWIQLLAMRRVYYLEHDIWQERREELQQTLLADQLAAAERSQSDVLKDEDPEPHLTNRDPWIPHPEMRDTVPNIALYSVLVGNLPSLPEQAADQVDAEAAISFSKRESIDWQLSLTTTFFDHCVPNQPGYSSSVAAVTIIPGAKDLAVAWNKWYAAASKLRRLRFIRQQIEERRRYDIESCQQPDDDCYGFNGGDSATIDYGYEEAAPAEEDRLRQKGGGTAQRGVYDAPHRNMEYYNQVIGQIPGFNETENQIYDGLAFGPEQTAVYSREFAQSAAPCCPNGCFEGRIRRLGIDDLIEMEEDAAAAVHQANLELRAARMRATKRDGREESEPEPEEDRNEEMEGDEAAIKLASSESATVVVPVPKPSVIKRRPSFDDMAVPPDMEVEAMLNRRASLENNNAETRRAMAEAGRSAADPTKPRRRSACYGDSKSEEFQPDADAAPARRNRGLKRMQSVENMEGMEMEAMLHRRGSLDRNGLAASKLSATERRTAPRKSKSFDDDLGQSEVRKGRRPRRLKEEMRAKSADDLADLEKEAMLQCRATHANDIAPKKAIEDTQKESAVFESERSPAMAAIAETKRQIAELEKAIAEKANAGAAKGTEEARKPRQAPGSLFQPGPVNKTQGSMAWTSESCVKTGTVKDLPTGMEMETTPKRRGAKEGKPNIVKRGVSEPVHATNFSTSSKKQHRKTPSLEGINIPGLATEVKLQQDAESSSHSFSSSAHKKENMREEIKTQNSRQQADILIGDIEQPTNQTYSTYNSQGKDPRNSAPHYSTGILKHDGMSSERVSELRARRPHVSMDGSAKDAEKGNLIEDHSSSEKWAQVETIITEASERSSGTRVVSGAWSMPRIGSFLKRTKNNMPGAAWIVDRTKEKATDVTKFVQKQSTEAVTSLARENAYAVITFTSRQAAVAARHCLADGRGAGRWGTLTDLPVPPLADAAAWDLRAFRNCCRPVTLSINDRQKSCRHYFAITVLVFLYTFYTIPLTLAAQLVDPNSLTELAPKVTRWAEEQGWDSTTLISGFITALIWSLFFALCPVMFKGIANFGSGATSVANAEFRALHYFWFFMLITAYAGQMLATIGLNALNEGMEVASSFQDVLREIGRTIPSTISATWLNWIIFRVTVILPLSYLIQANTYLLSWFQMHAFARLVRGGGPGGPLPYRIYVDSGVVLMCALALAPASPLVAPACFTYFLVTQPLWRRNLIFMYRPKYDGGGHRWPFIFDMCIHSTIVGGLLLAVQMGLKQALGPAILAGMVILPTLLFSNGIKRKYLRPYEDAALLQTSLLDGWDVNAEYTIEEREEFRQFLVDAHKAAYVPVCLAGSDTDEFLTAEPAVVVTTEADEEMDWGDSSTDGFTVGGLSFISGLDGSHKQSLQVPETPQSSHQQPGATMRRGRTRRGSVFGGIHASGESSVVPDHGERSVATEPIGDDLATSHRLQHGVSLRRSANTLSARRRRASTVGSTEMDTSMASNQVHFFPETRNGSMGSMDSLPPQSLQHRKQHGVSMRRAGRRRASLVGTTYVPTTAEEEQEALVSPFERCTSTRHLHANRHRTWSDASLTTQKKE